MTTIYLKIHDHIKQKIENNDWKVGERLPSERDLANLFEVSRMTLRQAINLLVEEGLLERRVGSGTFVTSKRVQEKVRLTTSFTDIIEKQGRIPSSKLISFIKTKPSQEEKEKLKLESNEAIIRMERVRYADDQALVYELTAIPEKLIHQVDQDKIAKHFFRTLKEAGYQIGSSSQTIFAKNVDEKVASLLNIKKGHAVLAMTQISYLTTNQPFEYVKSQYIGDRFEFSVENT